MECGIIGLPGSRKTCLITALTCSTAINPGGSGRPNIAVAAIPDPRLAVIAGYIEPRTVTPASITFVDIPGIDPGHGAARSGPLLAHVRQVDAICEVVRCFDGTDAQRDVIRLEEELVLADTAVVEPALDKAARAARSGDAQAKARVEKTVRAETRSKSEAKVEPEPEAEGEDRVKRVPGVHGQQFCGACLGQQAPYQGIACTALVGSLIHTNLRARDKSGNDVVALVQAGQCPNHAVLLKSQNGKRAFSVKERLEEKLGGGVV